MNRKIITLFFALLLYGLNSFSQSTGCQSGDCENGWGTYAYSGGGKYTGYFSEGYRDGFGIFEFANSDYFVGFWSEGEFEGYGTYIYGSVSGWKYERYIGQWVDHSRTGYGVYFDNSNIAEKGTYKSGTYENAYRPTGCVTGDCNEGFGTYVWEDGEVYYGNWKNGMRNGVGANFFASGGAYYGEWLDDQKHGVGTYSYPDKTFATGYWANDQWSEEKETGCISGDCNDGYGSYLFESGEKYEGYFKSGTYNGQGTYTFANEDVYVGNFLNGKRNGYGTYTFATGSQYVGQWKEDGYHGTGTYYYSNGNKYIGEFQNGVRQGKGKFIYANGVEEVGVWENDEFKGGGQVVDSKPVLTWITPQYFTSNSTTNSTMINICVKSATELKTVEVYVNNVLQQNSSTRGFSVVNDGMCDFTIQRTVSLNNGENEIKVVVNNGNSTVTSEIRKVTLQGGGQSSDQRKVALIIGNSNYTSSPLKNPENDAKSISAELKALGFDVIMVTNASQDEMKRQIRNFGAKLAEKPGTVGLFYFAGHGMQLDGQNFIIPVDADIQKEADVELEAVDLRRVLAEMEYARNQLNIVILDACRDNPFARSFRSGALRGLATTSAGQGTFIAYATAPGSVASDGSGGNGLYTQELLKALRQPGLKLEDVFKVVRKNVYEQSNFQQLPWENSAIFGDFYFRN